MDRSKVIIVALISYFLGFITPYFLAKVHRYFSVRQDIQRELQNKQFMHEQYKKKTGR